ncbi:hypothetical protein ACFV20_14210 [Streptomyces sp. NPDC059696]|uniref:hypothetical protein n=1 Tax=Streptomyces sp. NPDC059696 TaxID=3346911 RepID=UPI0036C3A2BC
MALLVAVLVAWIYEYQVYRWASWPEDLTWIDLYDPDGTGARVATGAVAGLLAGWQGGAEERNGARWMEGTSVRGPVSHRLMGLASGVVWPLAGYLLGMAAVLVWPQPVQLSGRIPLDAMSVDAAFIVAVSCIAYLLGQAIPLRVAPLILGLAAMFLGAIWGFLFGIHLTYTGDPIPRQVVSWAPPTPPVWLPWCRAVLVTALAAAAVLLSARRWKSAVALAVVSVTGVLGLSMTQPGGYEASALSSVEVRCRGHAPAVCISAPYEKQRPQLERIAGQLSERLKGVHGIPTHYVWTDDANLWEAGGVAGSSWAIPVDQPDLERLASKIVSVGDYSRSWLREVCDYSAYTSEYPSYTAEDAAVFDWLASCNRSSFGSQLAALPAPERTAWLNRYFAATKRGASPPPIPTPGER